MLSRLRVVEMRVDPAAQSDLPFDDVFADAMSEAAFHLGWRFNSRMKPVGSGRLKLATRTIIRRSTEGCIYHHDWHRSDPDDLHDHPWDFTSLVLIGGYWEVDETGRFWREPGSIKFRKAEERHRVELEFARSGDRVESLILTGPERREWGFQTEAGFVVGRDYRASRSHRPPRLGIVP